MGMNDTILSMSPISIARSPSSDEPTVEPRCAQSCFVSSIHHKFMSEGRRSAVLVFHSCFLTARPRQ